MDTLPHSEGTEQTIAETSKAPQEYTYTEFEGMSPEQQIEFQNSFASMEAFDEWLQKAKRDIVKGRSRIQKTGFIREPFQFEQESAYWGC